MVDTGPVRDVQERFNTSVALRRTAVELSRTPSSTTTESSDHVEPSKH